MKKIRIIIIVIVVCMIALVAGLLGYRGIQRNRVNQLLELGNQYLSDAQYEEAIATYKQVLAIEPKEETACENIVVAAVDWTDDLIEEKDFDKAREVLEDVQEVVVDSRLEAKFAEVETAQQAYEEEQEAEAQIMDMLNELAKICATEDANAIVSYMFDDDSYTFSDAYIAICDSEYFNFDTKYETENGSLGLYENGLYLYYGDYDGEQRSGQGAWYSYRGIYAVGTWENDKPNGTQISNCTWYDEDGVPGDSYALEGTVVDGLWDGNVVLTESYSYATVHWNLTYHNGLVVVLETDENGDKVSEYREEDDEYYESSLYFDSVEETAGILGFAEKEM